MKMKRRSSRSRTCRRRKRKEKMRRKKRNRSSWKNSRKAGEAVMGGARTEGGAGSVEREQDGERRGKRCRGGRRSRCRTYGRES